MSSVGVYGFNYPEDSNEEIPLQGDDDPFCESKILAEEIVKKFHEPGKFDVVIIRPGDIYGAQSNSWIKRPLKLMKEGKFFLPGEGNGMMNHVYIENLMEGIWLSINQNSKFNIFNITDGQRTTTKEYFTEVAQLIQIKKLPSLPLWVMRILANFNEWIYAPFKKVPPLNSSSLNFLTRKNSFSIDRARSELGYKPKYNLSSAMKKIKVDLERNQSP